MDKYRNYDITPVPTFYKGIKFRSRTEARWAVFFDYLKWDWSYEYRPYKLSTGYYLPDFYFHDFKAHGEVKPDELIDIERAKCIELSLMLPNTQVIQFSGNPGPWSLPIFENGALLTYAIPVSALSKFYPLFYSDNFNKTDFLTTSKAVAFATDHVF